MEKKLMIALYDENFLEIHKKTPKRIVVLGVKESFERYYPYLLFSDVFCELQESELASVRLFRDKQVISLEELVQLRDIYILFCINDDKTLFEQVCLILTNAGMDAKIFKFFDNISFPYFKYDIKYAVKESHDPMRVRLINYEGGGWILTKFAQRMNEYLRSRGIDSDIGRQVDPEADINHHIPSHPYRPFMAYNDTLMITHVDTKIKADQLKFQLEYAKMGICMSKQTMNQLECYGIPRDKICYINPAHDGNMKPKKYIIGITHRCYDTYDMRKRTNSLIDIVKFINPEYFVFIIMGSGWDGIVNQMREMGITVHYYSEFDYEKYHEIMPLLDYYMFFGFDEGSMGYLDALAAGVKTIVTPQGFHLDVPGGIDHACSTVEQFAGTLLDLQYEREKRISQIAEWSWENHAKKHVEIWNYLTGRQTLQEICSDKLWYEDGIFSCLLEDNTY